MKPSPEKSGVLPSNWLARYPGQAEEITSLEADESIRTAQAVLKWATEILRIP